MFDVWLSRRLDQGSLHGSAATVQVDGAEAEQGTGRTQEEEEEQKGLRVDEQEIVQRRKRIQLQILL